MYNYIKRIFDFTLSLILIVLFSPALFIISVTIFFDLGSPIFFKQSRGGLNGKSFFITKFKTMRNSEKEDISAKDDKYRTSNLGAFLRKYSIDEIPSLVNVLKGDMSFVGPRPLLAKYDKLYSEEQRKRFLVKPGITGWAQINGRNSISWEEKFKLDIWYIKNRNFILDFEIMFKTIFKVFNNKDIDSTKGKTMDEFKGNY
jgi:sugar transferase EpsL